MPERNLLVPASDEPKKPEQRPADPLKFFDDSGWMRERDGEWVEVCGAKCTSWEDDWKRCKQFHIMENGRCRMHGGASPKGINSPHFKTGRHSKHLPTDLQEQYEEFEADPNITQLRDEMALIDTRISDVLQMADLGASPKVWAELMDTWEDVKEARERYMEASEEGDRDEMETAIAELFGYLQRFGELVEGGERDQEAWDEVTDLVDERRKLTKAESRRILQSQKVVDVERVRTMVTRLNQRMRELITEYVPNDKRNEAEQFINVFIHREILHGPSGR